MRGLYQIVRDNMKAHDRKPFWAIVQEDKVVGLYSDLEAAEGAKANMVGMGVENLKIVPAKA